FWKMTAGRAALSRTAGEGAERSEAGEGSAERGFALVAVLCAAAILAVIVASVLATSRTEARLAQHRREIAELGAIAGGALNIALLRLLDPSINLQPSVDATPFTVSFAGRELRLTVQDEAGKIDLNRAGRDGLLRLLRTA